MARASVLLVPAQAQEGCPSRPDPAAGPCMHVAPIDLASLGPKSTYRFRYWLVVGTETQMAPRLDALGQKYASEHSEMINP